MQYKLEGHRAVPCADTEQWWSWFKAADRSVADTHLDDIRISTVFLGLEHDPLPDGRPALFETEVNVNGEAHPMRRYAVWEDAEAGHAEFVAMIQAEVDRAGGSLDEAAKMVWSRILQRLKSDQSAG